MNAYDPTTDIIKIIIWSIALIGSIVLMKKVKSKVPPDQISQESLIKNEKLLIWSLCFFNPLIAGAIFYYGWRKRLPVKAKQANTISFAAFGLFLVLWFVLGMISGK